MPAPKNNTNAKKKKSEVAGAVLNCRVRPAYKRAWKSAAGSEGLSSWVIATLNRAAKVKQ